MKRIALVLFIIFGVFGYIVFLSSSTTQNNSDYLRIHIRANSNLAVDQNVKYAVKNSLVDALFPIVANCKSKSELISEIENNKSYLEEVANNSLHKAKLDYCAQISVNSEYFPTRVYNNEITLKSGIYDALVVELGNAQGDNWWCIVYPPLCFMNVNYSKNINYQSRIVEMIKKFFS